MLDHVLDGIGALLFEGGAKSSQIYTRWLVAGNAGSFTDFMHERYAASATEAGTYVSGQVGQVATGLTDATIFLIWDGFLVVQGNKIMSLVPNANPAIGIVSEYLNSRELVMGMVIDVDAQTRADAVAPLNCC